MGKGQENRIKKEFGARLRLIRRQKGLSARATAAFNAAAPRDGRVIVQCRRCFLAHDSQPLSVSKLRLWAFAGRPPQHWHYKSIARALRRLGARRIGRATGGGRPGIWALI